MNVLRQLFFCGAVAVGVFVLGHYGAVRAQEMPCTDEIRTFCAEVQPGGGRILQCLKNNAAKLSPACTGRVNDLQETMGGPLRACRDDWVAQCYHPRASTGRQDMIQCLQSNQTKVSAGCQKALREVSGKRQQQRGMNP